MDNKDFWINIRVDSHTAALIDEIMEVYAEHVFPDRPSRSSVARHLIYRGIESFHEDMTPHEASWLPLYPVEADPEDWEQHKPE